MSSSDFPQRRPVSSHVKISPPSRSASKTRSPTINEHSPRSTMRGERVLWSAKPTLRNFSSGKVTAPTNVSGRSPFVTTVTFNKVLDFFHVQSLSNASFEEAILLHVLYFSLTSQIETLAATLPESLQRPLRALLAAMNEPGRSYTKQSAKRKQPSNSPASLRKRSSSA